MSPLRRWFVVLGIAVIAGLLAFPLRDTIYDTVIVPLAFLGFQIGLLYRTISQGIWWWLAIAVVLTLLVFSLIPDFKTTVKKDVKSRPRRGQVEDFSAWLGRAKSGIYFKWLIANRLGKLAYQLLLHRESGRPRSVFAPLTGTDWKPSKELQTYLEVGLHGSFSDYPNSGSSFGSPPKTPLDFEIREAVAFLESQVENSIKK